MAQNRRIHLFVSPAKKSISIGPKCMAGLSSLTLPLKDRLRVLRCGSAAKGFSFGVATLAPGKGHARHNHPGSEEIIYFISGEGEQMVHDQAPVKVGPGTCVYIPADVYHSTLNTGGETMQLIVAYSPAGPERLLREIPGCKVAAAAG